MTMNKPKSKSCFLCHYAKFGYDKANAMPNPMYQPCHECCRNPKAKLCDRHETQKQHIERTDAMLEEI